MVDSPQKGQPFVRGDLLAVAQVDDQVYLFRTDTGCAALITVTGTVQVFQFLIQLVRIHVVTVFSLFLIVLKSAGTVGPGSPPLFHTLVPEQFRDALRRYLCRPLRHRIFVSTGKCRGIFLTCNSPGTGGVYWRLLACPIAFRDDKAVCSGQFWRYFFHARVCRLFLHFRLILVSCFCFHCRDVHLFSFPHRRTRFLFHFPFRAFTPFLLFLFHRIEPPGNTPQGFCHAAACLPETYFAELSPEQELVHEQIGEQQPEQDDSGFIVT